MPSQYDEDFRELLADLDEGTVLYTVLVSSRETPNVFQKIGEIVLESRFVASSYGDTILFFQHNLL